MGDRVGLGAAARIDVEGSTAAGSASVRSKSETSKLSAIRWLG